MGVVHHGHKNPNWKKGRSIASNGYVLIRVGEGHPIADVRGYAYEHRLIAFAKIGRMLLPGEIAHHIDGNKQNNDWANIAVLNHAEHGVEHRSTGKAKRLPGEPNPIVLCACGCGESFERYDSHNRQRKYVTGHNMGGRTR